MNEEKMSDDVPTDISLTRAFQGIIKKGDSEELIQFLSQHSPNVKSTRGGFRTPLTFACYYARGPIVQILLAYNANPNILDPEGQSCLINYLSTRELIPERDIPVINAILERSPHLINLRSQRGITPLYQAVAYDAPLEIIQFLLDKGADVNQPGPDGSVILIAVNNLVSTLKEQRRPQNPQMPDVEGDEMDAIVGFNRPGGVNPENIFSNSVDILRYLLRNPNIMIPDLPDSIKQRYPEIVSFINKERQRSLYNKQFAEKGKQAAVLREMNVFPDDIQSDILKYLFKRKSGKKKKSIKKSNKKAKKSSKIKKSNKKAKKSIINK